MIRIGSILEMIEKAHIEDVGAIDSYDELFVNCVGRNRAGPLQELQSMEVDSEMFVVWFDAHSGRILLYCVSSKQHAEDLLTIIKPPFNDVYCNGIFICKHLCLVEFHLKCATRTHGIVEFNPASKLYFPEIWIPGTAFIEWQDA